MAGRRKLTVEERKAIGARAKADAPLERVISATMPEKPTDLSPAEEAIWDRVVAKLVAHGLTNDLDEGVLKVHCHAVAKVDFYTAYLRDNSDFIVHDNGNKTKREEVRMRAEAVKEMMRTGAVLGMSPASRKTMGIRVEGSNKRGVSSEKMALLKRQA